MRRTLSVAALATLSVGASGIGQEPSTEKEVEPWLAMDYGPCLSTTARGADDGNVALKGRVIFLAPDAGVLFDTELLRVASAWVGGEFALRGTPFDGAHGPIPEVRGHETLVTRLGPGWSIDRDFGDPRPIPHGPLARGRGRFQGHYLHGREVVLAYRVGETSVLESFRLVAAGGQRGIVRTVDVGSVEEPLQLVVVDRPRSHSRIEVAAPNGGGGTVVVGARDQRIVVEYEAREPRAKEEPRVSRPRMTLVGAVDAPDGAHFFIDEDGRALLSLPIGTGRSRVQLVAWDGSLEERDGFDRLLAAGACDEDLSAKTRGGPARWSEVSTTRGRRGEDDGSSAWVIDTLTVPESNPWRSRLRFGAFDFVDATRAALSTWNGDVWIVSGIDDGLDRLEWRRFATGLHDPLGLKVVGGVVHTLGRDQITRLHDLDADGEADFYENFNNDVLVTRNFHEFAFDLQTDQAGNFYFAKGGPVRPGGRGFDAIVPHHGTMLRVSKDGTRCDVVLTGLRAPNGMAVAPDGILTTGDNQGTWMPACRINYMRPGGFGGVMDLAHREPRPTTHDDPLCWLPMDVDNSGGGQTWVVSDRFGPLQGELLHLSYGTCNLYLVLRQLDGERVQGGVVRFPLSFASSLMRGRFNLADGHLYVCGFKGWQTRAAKETAFQRVRHTGRPLRMPRALEVTEHGIAITFTDALDAETATDPESFGVEQWNYLYSEAYGSAEYSVAQPDRKVAEGEKNRDTLTVRSAKLSADRRTVFLSIDGLTRVMQMRITYDLEAADGTPIEGEIHNTINFIGKDPGRGGPR